MLASQHKLGMRRRQRRNEENMDNTFNENLQSIVSDITLNYQEEEMFFANSGFRRPNRSVIIEIIYEIRWLWIAR